MSLIHIPIQVDKLSIDSADRQLFEEALQSRKTAEQLFEESNYIDALERTATALRTLRDFSDFDHLEFRVLLVTLLFDLSEIHFQLKDYKQSEKELDLLFKLLDNLIKIDEDRFGKYHILAMELSTRILRSRKKTLDLLVKQQINAGQLYEKVNAGVSAATEKLVESLRNIGELLASSGDYRSSLKFYSEAIKLSKKRSGKVARKEVKMTIEMARIMMRVNQMRPRAKRLLNAVLPHAIALETIELEQEILSMIEIIDADVLHEPKWKTFFHKITESAKGKLRRKKNQDPGRLESSLSAEETLSQEGIKQLETKVEGIQKIADTKPE